MCRRVKLRFEPEFDKEDVWLLVRDSVLTVQSLKESAVSLAGLSHVEFYLDNAIVPDYESTSILRDGDEVLVASRVSSHERVRARRLDIHCHGGNAGSQLRQDQPTSPIPGNFQIDGKGLRQSLVPSPATKSPTRCSAQPVLLVDNGQDEDDEVGLRSTVSPGALVDAPIRDYPNDTVRQQVPIFRKELPDSREEPSEEGDDIVGDVCKDQPVQPGVPRDDKRTPSRAARRRDRRKRIIGQLEIGGEETKKVSKTRPTLPEEKARPSLPPCVQHSPETPPAGVCGTNSNKGKASQSVRTFIPMGSVSGALARARLSGDLETGRVENNVDNSKSVMHGHTDEHFIQTNTSEIVNMD